jgi:hypothetical protein
VRAKFRHTFGMLSFGGRRVGGVARDLLLIAGIALLLAGAGLAAQTIPIPQGDSVPTLHVYTNLIQIPTVVLEPNLEPLKTPIEESKFSVSVDSGPWFRATHVRREGDDPISLAILLDMRFGEGDFIPKLRDAIAGLAPLGLHEKDHVSIYALGCDLMRSSNDVPANAPQLGRGVDEALKFWSVQDTVICLQQDHVWDALSYIAGQLYQLPGRRVILALSQGIDIGSKHTWNETRAYLQTAGVAVFAISHVVPRPKTYSPELNPFSSVCESSGGVVFHATVPTFAATVQTFVTTVRNRYIVEFPRPSNATLGVHDMKVKIAGHSSDLVVASGISVPIADPAVAADPTTVSAGPKDAPELGDRHPLKKPQ